MDVRKHLRKLRQLVLYLKGYEETEFSSSCGRTPILMMKFPLAEWRAIGYEEAKEGYGSCVPG